MSNNFIIFIANQILQYPAIDIQTYEILEYRDSH